MEKAILCSLAFGIPISFVHYLFYVKIFPPDKNMKINWMWGKLINLVVLGLTFSLLMKVGLSLDYLPIDNHGTQDDHIFQILVLVFYFGSAFWFGYIPNMRARGYLK